MTSGKKIFQPVKSKSVYLIYELLYKERLVAFPLTESGAQKVDALVSSICSEYFGVASYETNEEKAVAYLYLLIKDHPFTDGNKRTATLVFEVVCEINNLTPSYKDFGLDALAVFIEKIKEKDHHLIIKVLAEFLFEKEK